MPRKCHERKLPDGSRILALFTSNNLNAVRSLLDPLTLRGRRLVMKKMVDQKSLLYHACYLGLRDIAKYFIDECGADIENGYRNGEESISPMFLANQRLDICLILQLIRRSSNGSLCKLTELLDSNLSNEYYALVGILGSFKIRSCDTFSFSPKYGIGGTKGTISFRRLNSYISRSKSFLRATYVGNLSYMKLLLACGVDAHLKTVEENNALCLAILKKWEKIEHFLVANIYSPKSYALALELCGAKFIIFQTKIKRGLMCWRKSILIRQNHGIGFEDKILMDTNPDLGVEFQTKEEIEVLKKKNDQNVFLQALIVFLRIVPNTNQVIHNAFVTVSKHKLFNDDLVKSMKILSVLYNFPIVYPGFRNPTFRALDTLLNLFVDKFLRNHNTTGEFMTGLSKIFDLLNKNDWIELLRRPHGLYKVAYTELLQIVLNFHHLAKSYPLKNDDKRWMVTSYKALLKKTAPPYPTTLIHLAIQRELSLSVISFLLFCSADPNSCDRFGNKPLHLLSSWTDRDCDSRTVMNLLVQAGGHLDSVNMYGIRPLDLLVWKGLIEYPLKFLSLKCLAAQAIYKYRIIVTKEMVPETLLKFITDHTF